MKEKLERKEKQELKKQRKYIDSFKDLLRSSRVGIEASDTWSTAKSKLEGHKAYDALSDSALKQKLFEEYIDKLHDSKGKDSKKRYDDADDDREKSKSRGRDEDDDRDGRKRGRDDDDDEREKSKEERKRRRDEDDKDDRSSGDERKDSKRRRLDRD
jgi:hypothetical protein